MPHIRDRHIQTTSSYREQVTDTMCHMHHPHDIMCSLEFTHYNNPKPAICACKGQSPGFNAITQAYQAPWLRPGTTTKEQDIQSASAALLKREKKRLPATGSKQTAAPGTPSTFNLPKSPASPYKAISPQGLNSSPAQSCRTAHTHMHLCIAYNIQSGEAVHLGTNTPHLVPCLQASEAFMEDPDEAGGVTTMEDSAPASLQDSKTMESAFTAKTADTEVVQPCMLREAQHATDKPLSAPIPSVTDPAPASAAECTITHNVPYYEAVNTFNWAALAMHLDTTFPDMNGSMAIDQYATLAHASFIDDGAICWPSRQQEDISLTTPKNNHVTAMHSGKEALCPHSPTPYTFSSPKAFTTSFSNGHPPYMFIHNHSYHPLDHTY